MLDNLNIENVLFLDIETAPAFPSYDELPDDFRKHWDRKTEFIRKEEGDTPDLLYRRAGIYAEFGKIICISVGFVKGNEIRIKSFYGDDEKQLLHEFNSLLDTYYDLKRNFLCAHNGKEFDFPYIARRTLINGLKIPGMLDLAGKKPWDIPHLDTMELWKFGDFKSFTSLDLLTSVFGIPTPKDDIDGSEVGKTYWEDKDLERIVNYCQKDVVAIIRLFLKYQGKEDIPDEYVKVVD